MFNMGNAPTEESNTPAPAAEQPNMEMGAEDPSMGGGMPQEEGMDDGYAQEIIANLEQHLNSLPDEAKAFIAEYISTPEGATLVGLINGREVYDYFSQFIDSGKSLVVQPSAGGQPGAMAPSPEAGMQPQAAQPQMQTQAPQGQSGVFNAPLGTSV